jgi:SAM-dependent methyltransferase
MFRREDQHWWYAGMRQVALAVLRRELAGCGSLRILDAGCGTGGTTVRLAEFGTVFGVDYAWEALKPAASRGLGSRLARASVERLPFQDGTFDVAASFEVIYHAGVANDVAAFRELRRVLRLGGLLLLRLPAHDWLRGAHDRLVHTRHRYTKREVGRKLRAAGFTITQLSWANSLLFPPAAAKRLLERGGHSSAAAAAEPDLWQPPGPVNALLTGCLALERHALTRRVALPPGLSVLAVARAA